MEQNKEKVLEVELKLDYRFVYNMEVWDEFFQGTEKIIECVKKEHGYDRTQLKLSFDSREF